MTYTVTYDYHSFSLGCDCCSDPASEIEIYGNGELVAFIPHAPLIENDQELIEYMTILGYQISTLTIDPNNRYF